jgi:prepilin-type N-terminal cleavage/methylation domain-containing protein/prepilin-type processing-associated H-X9-DG protein
VPQAWFPGSPVKPWNRPAGADLLNPGYLIDTTAPWDSMEFNQVHHPRFRERIMARFHAAGHVPQTPRRAFTLIELLVVIAIIAILIGLLIPAVQKVREAAANASCRNNLHQWGLAMHNYENVNKTLPLGCRSGPRQTWVMYLWPYIEQDNLTVGLNYKTQDFYTPPCTQYNTLNGLTGAYVSLYYCPSDVGTGAADLDDPSQTYTRRRGNYVVNWGMVYHDGQSAINTRGPFYLVDYASNGRTKPGRTRISDIKDGTANTMMMAEYLRAWSHDDNDWRGDIQNDDGTFCFMVFTTPNSTTPDDINWANNPVGNTDPLMPVTTAGSDVNEFSTARSRHTGGVNVLFCDGSVHFITNGITLSTWQALGTMSAGDNPGPDWQ